MLSTKFFSVFIFIAVGITAILSFSGCNFIGSNNSAGGLSSNSPNLQARPTRDPNAVNYFESVEELNKMKAAFAERVGGKMKVLYIQMGENYAEIQAQDPNKPENVDQYRYRNGEMEKVLPVKLSGPGKLENSLFDYDDVNLDKIPELVAEAKKRAKDLEGMKASGLRIERGLMIVRKPSDANEPMINISVSGTRKGAYLKADLKGNNLEYKEY